MPNDLRLLWRFKRSAAAFSAAAFPGIEQSMMKVVEREKTAPNGDFLAPNTLGIYIQVPFCQTKCTYCNFHTGVASPSAYAPYARAVEREITNWRALHAAAGLESARHLASGDITKICHSEVAAATEESAFRALQPAGPADRNATITINT